MTIFIYFLLLLLNYDVLIYTVYISLLAFGISIIFNFLELKKNKENLSYSNQILLENKKSPVIYRAFFFII